MRKKGTFLILIGFALILAAGVWFLRNKQEEKQAEKAAAAVMGRLKEETSPGPDPAGRDPAENGGEQEYGGDPDIKTSERQTPDYLLDPDREMPKITVDGFDYIGYLEVPSIGMDLPVQSEWSYPGLRIAPCRYSGSVYRNDMVICGHNYFPGFIDLTGVSLGDAVRFTDMDGNVFVYQVAALEILEPDQVNEMTDSGWDLSLFTCTYSTVSRVTVRCQTVPEH